MGAARGTRENWWETLVVVGVLVGLPVGLVVLGLVIEHLGAAFGVLLWLIYALAAGLGVKSLRNDWREAVLFVATLFVGPPIAGAILAHVYG